MNRKFNWHDINDPGHFLTDDMSEEPQVIEPDEPEPPRPVGKLYDPRWYHISKEREKESPDMAEYGDEILLEIKVDGIVEGAGIDIVVRDDTSRSPFLTKRTLRARVKNNLLRAKWKVDRNKNDADEPDYQFDANYEGYSGKASCPSAKIPVAVPLKCDYIEIPDILFNFDSPLPCLDSDGKLLGSLVTACRFHAENPGKQVILFGHADATGDPSYNFDLSKWRSEAVKSLLDGNKQRWVELAEPQATIEDQQKLLSILTRYYGWRCDPGSVDKKDGPQTRSAREVFQNQFNEKFKGNLKVDGIWGEITWGAVFDVLRFFFTDAYKKATGESSLPQLSFGYEGKGIYPCGESFPIEGLSGTDAKNRRVEICFFEKGKEPKLLEHPNKATKVTVKENPVYDTKRTQKKPVEVEFEPLEIKTDICIAFFFDGTGKNKDVDIPKGCESNVAKLFELFKEIKEDNGKIKYQKAYYLRGVGTDECWYKDLPGLSAGFGGQDRISTAFRILGDFVRTHKDRKEIFVDVFGYSRGAALARHFVNVIHEFGIFDRDAKPIGKKTVTCHIDGKDHTTEIPIYPKHQNVTVRFLGLFDTVGSFGLPGNDTNIGYTLDVHANRIKRAVHYIAKHEYRRNFDLTSIRRPLNETAPRTPDAMSRFISTKPLPPHMEERFFIGSHGDVGGGTPQGNQGKTNELALVPLYAMVHEAIKAGVPLFSIEEWKEFKPARYKASFKMPDKLLAMAQVCKDWRKYAEMCDENSTYCRDVQKTYCHDSREDGLAGGAFLDKGNTNRTVYYHGIY